MGVAPSGQHPGHGRPDRPRRGPPRTGRVGARLLALADRRDLLQPAGGRQPGHRLCRRRADARGPSPRGGRGVGPCAGDESVRRRDPHSSRPRPGCPAAPGARRRVRQQLRADLPLLPRPGPQGQRGAGLRRGRGRARPVSRRSSDGGRLRHRRAALQRTALRLRGRARPAPLRPSDRRRPRPLPGRHPLGPARGRAGRRARRPLRVHAGLADPGRHAARRRGTPYGINCARARSRWPSTSG